MKFFGRHTLGVLDAETDEVPGNCASLHQFVRCRVCCRSRGGLTLLNPIGTVLLLSKRTQEPLGIGAIELKRTANGIILEPQPDEDPNDPLNWPSWQRDFALLSLGWHCLIGGGQTPVLAAGFNDVASTFGVTIPQVALTTGMMDLLNTCPPTCLRSCHGNEQGCFSLSELGANFWWL